MPRARLVIVVPRRSASEHASIDAALAGFQTLSLGDLQLELLRALPTTPADPVLGRHQRWRTITPYTVTRHIKGVGAKEAIRLDVEAECTRSHQPPLRDIEVSAIRALPGVGLQAHVVLEFTRTKLGPLILGRQSHKGGGFFEAAPSRRLD